MKILVASNLYPPHYQGGYELRCAQVADYLRSQGHTIRIITSTYQIDGTSHRSVIREDEVAGIPVSRFLRQHRLDNWQPSGWRYNTGVIRRQLRDIARFGEVLDEFKPDLVNWWNLEGVSKAILRLPHARAIPCVHCIDDNWMIREFGVDGDVDLPLWINFWRVNWGPRPLRPVVRVALAPFERRTQGRGIPTEVFRVPPSHLLFISEFRRYQHRQAGIDRPSDVIYGGVSPKRFLVNRTASDYARVPLRLLYAGYIDQRRGLHTIVEALGLLTLDQRERVHLSIAHAGPVVPDEYVNSVIARIAALDLSKHITFLGRVPHDEMPGVYAAHDVLVFASTRSEGMPMVMMEAMCAGCAVPNTGSGGAIELSDRAGTPIFPTDHPFALSRLLSSFEKDRMRVADIALRGQQTVLKDFTIDRMLEQTCDVFTRVAGRAHRAELQPASH